MNWLSPMRKRFQNQALNNGAHERANAEMRSKLAGARARAYLLPLTRQKEREAQESLGGGFDARHVGLWMKGERPMSQIHWRA